MDPDVADTVRVAPRAPTAPREQDFDDTVVRRVDQGRASPPTSLAVPPALVEPPAPALAPRAVSTIVDLVSDEDAGEDAGDAPPSVLLADGREVALDVTVYLGRRPSAPRIHTGPAPRLVTLASPAKEMSATHLELRVVGGSIVATDMRSTNGTIVQRPGSAPQTLVHGESAVVVPGTRIDLGEGAVLDILSSRVAGAS